ncbi:riboflavin kinase [Domibacillus sp. PGB-M46]|uniref:riboflavin kinase n=1 Tax=Domibacillus sp. PGB-M46 TaxID=2910255 RepID=UPI001F58E924|nr:riboflavin kinase [Domibacillus sp. PGB-M46]MCI2256303.1 riboflavin kinase [Domibacillus sp. PGB-M46]
MADVQYVQWISKPAMDGEVIHGMKTGRKLGFPTANLSQSPDWIENGVYGVQVQIEDELLNGVMNIGVKPTFGSRFERITEIHLFDFQGDLYGKRIQCVPLFRIRDEQKFSSFHSLLQQIKEDVNYARTVFSRQGAVQRQRIS